MFLPPCSSNLSLNLPWLRNFTGKNLDLKPLKPTWPQLLCRHQGRHQGLPTPLQHLTSTVSSASKPDPVRATNVSPTQNLHAKKRHSLLQVKKQNPASSCTIIYTPVTSNHIAKSLSKQKSEHNTHPCKSAANKQF